MQTPTAYQQRLNTHFESTLPYWSEIYESDRVYARIYQERRIRALRFIDELGLPTASCVLEVGCGPGLTTLDLARRGFKVDAIDTVAAMVQQTTTRIQAAGLQHEVRISM